MRFSSSSCSHHLKPWAARIMTTRSSENAQCMHTRKHLTNRCVDQVRKIQDGDAFCVVQHHSLEPEL
ncbi:uncharacterized protein EI90DRAFT_801032 [Cantharellus anzutake]|uniref:uncharacterized protein n=1 Tax=Cantharellus anzutake TaxID=1750568 RepID=UPI001906BA1C|nr:uncharacterized protein EI90DRAFT_801032 [Cantharellus anzutake]KAF8342887.1 hypothetical protein EI90DRAFT_801032 [Cantharellus anzutake]